MSKKLAGLVTIYVPVGTAAYIEGLAATLTPDSNAAGIAASMSAEGGTLVNNVWLRYRLTAWEAGILAELLGTVLGSLAVSEEETGKTRQSRGLTKTLTRLVSELMTWLAKQPATEAAEEAA